ncbi:MAG TPA: MATE family efflux transporter [Longimicrobiaceae bacterium]|nr:MATE family efflux transporter [Longimicrobiaceae bacterium]
MARPATHPQPGGRRRGVLLLHESRALLGIAGPVILSQLGTVGMNTLDTIMVGPLGARPLAAVGLGSALHTVALMICTGTLLGMAPLVSQAFGARDRDGCRQVLLQGLWLSLWLSVPLIVMNAIGEPLTLLMGQDPDVSELVGEYMAALAWGVVPVLLFMAFRQFLEGMGIAKPAMVITILGLGMNYLANRAFIYGIPGWIDPMGMVGTGWATTAVRWGMFVAMVLYIYRRPDLHPFRGVHWKPESRLLRRIAWIGAPTGAQIGLEVGLFSFAAVVMGWFGALQLATHQVTINIAATTFMVAMGVSIAGSIRVGHHIGAGSVRGIRRSVLLTYVLSIGFMAVCALAFLAIPGPLMRLYTNDPAIVRLGASLLFVAAIFQIFDGAQVAGFSVLRGAADTRVPMLIAGFAYWIVGAPTALYLAFRTPMGPIGVWAGLCVGLAVAGILLLHRVRLVLWR